ncbi:unnamed protein product [Rotaria sp. Silwood2]|nr:unnamed protein product [Rotaria sp. Silwood2]CAF3407358.1 unnamed protein product [Rotaria sp. Silwood2]CAF4374703.1 unnamed protein product [Rotaria sp. Silwood2]CAF4455524.1 unnamed protein product [Rotaria sp. Silwood2]
MECDTKYLNQILRCLFGEHSLQGDDDYNHNEHTNDDQCKMEPMEVSNMTDVATSAEAAVHCENQENQRYCLIIFNNPRWSRILHKGSTNIPKQNMEQQQKQLISEQSQGNFHGTFNPTVQSSVKTENNDTSLDDVFVKELKKLITDYIQRTTRPLPLKYFLDFTEQ